MASRSRSSRKPGRLGSSTCSSGKQARRCGPSKSAPFREAANEGVFTPSSHLRPHIQFPGAWGGANWGSTAGDPTTGMVYVRSLELISYRKMSLVTPGAGGGGGGGRGQGAPPGPREQEGQNVYMQRCAGCHGPGQMPLRSLKVITSQGLRSIVRQGVNSMPGFPQSLLSNDALESFLMSLPTSDEQAGNPSEIRLPQNPNRSQGLPATGRSSQPGGWSSLQIHRIVSCAPATRKTGNSSGSTSSMPIPRAYRPCTR